MLRVATSSFALIVALAAISGCRGDDAAPATAATTSGGEGGGGEGGSGSGAATPGGPLVVLDWNIRNAFDTKRDSADAGETVLSQAQYDAKLDKVAAVLATAKPDVAVFAEVENEAVLADLAGRMGSEYVAHELIEGNDPRGIDVGIISKIPIDEVVSHKDEEFPVEGTAAPLFQFTRDCPEFHMTVGKTHVVFLAVHFRSKAGEDLPDKRLAEAQRARAIADGIAAEDPKAAIFILGDYNDVPGSNPVEQVRTQEPPFVDAPDFVDAADRWTFNFQGTHELIDHQMVNPVAAGYLDHGSVTIDHSAAAIAASDHAPIWATYQVP